MSQTQTSGRLLRRTLARLPIYWENTRDNPQWLAMFVFGRLLPVRRVLWPPFEAVPRQDTGQSMFRGTDPSEIARVLIRTGLWCGLQLPEQFPANIHRFAERTPCFANLDRQLEFMPLEHTEAESQFGRPILTGHYFDRLEDCAEIRQLRADPLLNAAATAYLGTKAKVVSTRLWWSFPAKNAADTDLSLASQEKLHFDLDDWRALKFFFYLTPVGPENGPHVYMQGSHRRRLLRHQWTLTVGHPNDQVLASYGAENQVTVLGGAGYGFAMDPFGFHMGKLVRQSPRLMLEIGFGVTRLLGGRFHGEGGRSPLGRAAFADGSRAGKH
jgi:hypothetical protein